MPKPYKYGKVELGGYEGEYTKPDGTPVVNFGIAELGSPALGGDLYNDAVGSSSMTEAVKNRIKRQMLGELGDFAPDSGSSGLEMALSTPEQEEKERKEEEDFALNGRHFLQDYYNSEGRKPTSLKDAPNYEGDFIVNFGNAMAQAAQGPATPQINQGLYNNMNQQTSRNMLFLDKDMDRKQKIKNAILERQNKLDMAKVLAGKKETQADDKAISDTAQWADKMDSDPTIRAAQQNLESLKKGLNTLQPGKKLLPNQLSDAEIDFGNALAFKGSQGLSNAKMHEIQTQTLKRDQAKLKRYFGKEVDMWQEDPELVESIRSNIASMIDDYNKTIYDLKNKKIENRLSIVGGSRLEKPLQKFKEQHESSKPIQTKVINGVTYEKVEGGWQRVK